MGTETTSLVVHPEGEQPEIEGRSAVADTYAGRVHVEWDATAPVTPFGQLPFFIEYLKLSNGKQSGPRIGMEKGPLTGVGAGLSR